MANTSNESRTIHDRGSHVTGFSRPLQSRIVAVAQSPAAIAVNIQRTVSLATLKTSMVRGSKTTRTTKTAAVTKIRAAP
jgi:hypothetical protein